MGEIREMREMRGESGEICSDDLPARCEVLCGERGGEEGREERCYFR